MRPHRIILLLALLVPARAAEAGIGDVSAEVFAAKGLQDFYSLEFAEAAEAYRKAIERDPQNPLHWINLADACLFQHIYETGAFHERMYSASESYVPDGRKPSPRWLEQMWEALNRARALAEARLEENPNDAEAHYAIGLLYATQTNYYANVAGKHLDALRSGTRAREHHMHVRRLDPSNHDANLILGLYEYAVGSLPPALKFLVFFIGHTGSKQRGIELMQDAMLRGKRSAPGALSLLALAYTREGRHAYAREMVQHLHRFFPRNYFFEMEIAATFVREGNPHAAIETYQHVEQRMLEGAPGYDRIDAARLYFQIAYHLQQEDRREEAIRYYTKSAQVEGIDPALAAQCYLRAGGLYRDSGKKELARAMYERVLQIPLPDARKQAEKRLRELSQR